MEDEPSKRRGLFWAAVYVAFCVALYWFVAWGWPLFVKVMPNKFWSVF